MSADNSSNSQSSQSAAVRKPNGETRLLGRTDVNKAMDLINGGKSAGTPGDNTDVNRRSTLPGASGDEEERPDISVTKIPGLPTRTPAGRQP